MQDCDLFKVNGIYPRKYFDDLMLADKLTDQYLKKPFELMRSSSNIRQISPELNHNDSIVLSPAISTKDL